METFVYKIDLINCEMKANSPFESSYESRIHFNKASPFTLFS